MSSPRSGTGARRRNGMTLVELLITLVLLGIVAGGMMGIISRQQRFYSGSSGVLDTRSTVRQGIDVMQSELRAILPRRDIHAMGRTFIDYREPRGASVICAAAGTDMTIPPTAGTAGEHGLSAWVRPPEPGDSVIIYDINRKTWIDNPPADSAWEIVSVTPNTSAGACAGFLGTGSGVTSSYTIRLDHLLPAQAVPGASLRFFRTARYDMVQAANGDWYLGYRECHGSPVTCDELMPVSGPYLPPADAGPSGLELGYFAADGTVAATPGDVRRIDIVLRARSTREINMEGRAKGFYQDSLRVSVATRNN